MRLTLAIITLFFLYAPNILATNIRVIDFDKIINNNEYLISLYNDIDQDQTNHIVIFENQEKQLQNDLENLDQLKLILDNIELQNEVKIYNDKLDQFNLKIKNFNAHYDNQIVKLKNIIVNSILEILKSYSLINEIDLILDSKNYIISNNNINITNDIINETKKIKIEFNFEKY